MLVSVLCDICVLSCRLNTFRRVLDAEMKDLTADGVALKTKRAEEVGISAEEEKMFWDKGLLGCQTAETLVNTIYFCNGKRFGIWAKEHRDLRYANIKIVDSNSIVFDESHSKTFHGGLKDLKYTPRVIKHVCCRVENLEHFPCTVNCYSLYLEKIKSLAEEIDAFYFKPHPNEFIYMKVPIGINTLNKILPDKLCVKAGLPRKTSHNLRVTCATRLFQESVEERLIRERTGHRSNALFKYEKSSVEQQHQVSKILGPPENRETTGKRSNAEVSENELESLLPTDLEFEVSDDVLSNMPLPDYCTNGIENFSRCVFHNCTINLVQK